MSVAAAPVYGLILAGGSSSRMQRDKAALLYQGQAQLDRAFDRVARHVSRVFVSVREDQTRDPTRAGRPLIVDSAALAEEAAAGGSSGGPIVGIRSALAAFPDVAWLVVACDLPFLSDAALEQLLLERDPDLLATAFRSVHDGLPEPLCAVWEPAAAALAAHQRAGRSCPRKFLINHPVKLLEPEDRRALDNINTPAEYAAARGALQDVDPGTGAHPMQLTIQYFALMREQAGRSHETLETAAATPADLYAELQHRYGFTLPREQLKVAVNSDFADWSRRLVGGDSVVFIPPVAGG
jgi:molybdopterin-guanine dinucleotide biosynthesis protein A